MFNKHGAGRTKGVGWDWESVDVGWNSVGWCKSWNRPLEW